MEKMTKLRIIGIFLMPEPTAEVPLMAWNQIGR